MQNLIVGFLKSLPPVELQEKLREEGAGEAEVGAGEAEVGDQQIPVGNRGGAGVEVGEGLE